MSVERNVLVRPRTSEKQGSSAVWTEAGYDLFAHEGWHHIQVERLARILRLNKSSFYHYFGDLEGFSFALITMHEKNINNFVKEMREIKRVDPEYILLFVKHAATMMFHIQLSRDRGPNGFYEISVKLDRWIDIGICQMWLDFLDVTDNSDLGMRYFRIVRDMLYTRATFENLNYAYLHGLVKEAKTVLKRITECKNLE